MPVLFLSHIHEETELAQIIQKSIVSTFGGLVEVFVSTDNKSIKKGDDAFEKIQTALSTCDIVLPLLSPISVDRRWINIETGAAWLKKIINPAFPIMTLCHSGMKKDKSPSPFNKFQATQINEKAELEALFKSIQLALKGSGELNTDFDSFQNEIISFEKKYTVSEKLLSIFVLLGINNAMLSEIYFHKQNNPDLPIKIKCDCNKCEQVKVICDELPKNVITNIIIDNYEMLFFENGKRERNDISINIDSKTLNDCKEYLVAKLD